MQFRRTSTILLWAAVSGVCLAAKDSEPTTTAPCTAHSTNEAFFDLRPDVAVAPEEGEKRKAFRATDYTARGYDYNANFTLNICAAVVKPPKEAVGISDKLLRNVSAYYEKKGKIYSLGYVFPSRRPRLCHG
jgi:cation-dependent mannose-6-phosphate receptor